MVRGGRAEAPVSRSDVSFRLDQKTAKFKAVIAIVSREMQWSALTGEKPLAEVGQVIDGILRLRRADAAQVCSNLGFVAVDGDFECSPAIAARQIVSERW